MSAKTTHKLYNKYAPQIKLTRDAVEGQEALIANAQTYFPKVAAQDEKDYQVMIRRPAYDNLIEQHLDTITGMMTKKPPIKEIPTKLEPLLESMDLSNKKDIDIFQDLAFELLTAGRVGMLIQYDNGGFEIPTIRSVLEQKARPYIKVYQTESIINWRVENNKLIMVVLSEIVEEWISQFETKDTEQQTVLYLQDNKCYRKIIRQDKDKNDYVVDGSEIEITINGKPIDFIPFVVGNQNTLEITPYKPPLYNMARVAISRHQLKIDHYWSLMYHAYSLLVHKTQNAGQNKSPIQIGATAVTEIGLEESIEFVEFKGEGAKFQVEEIEACKQIIGDLGANFIKNEGNSKESYESKLLRAKESNASLVNVADVVSRMMVRVLEIFSMYYLMTDEIKYEIDLDYSETKSDSNMLKVLMDGVTMGNVAQIDLYNYMKENGLTQFDTFQAWQGSLESQAIPLMIEEPQKINEDEKILIEDLRNIIGLESKRKEV